MNLAFAVLLGAFGAHALRSVVSEQAMEWFRTGHDYHMWHGLGALIVLLVPVSAQSRRRIMGLMFAGTFFFAGSLYLMAVTGIRVLGAITPIGGLCWIVAWTWLAVVLWKEFGPGTGEGPEDAV